jgi:acid stress chaperone HdeA
MSKTTLVAGTVLAAMACAPAVATEERVDPTKMTCEAFVALTEEAQPRVLAWLDGYSRAGRPPSAVPVALREDAAIIRSACRQTPKQSVRQKMRAQPPGGKETVPDPARMTCAEFLGLAADVQPEVVYWLDGYNAGAEQGGAETAGTKGGGVTGTPVLVALDHDVAFMVKDCRETPTLSLWETTKSKL